MSDPAQAQYVEPYLGLANIYDRVMEHVNYKQWARYIKTLLDSQKVTIYRLADLSCGTGSFLAHLSIKKARKIGCDLSLPMLRRAQQKTEIKSLHLCAGDFNAIPIRSNSVSAAVALYDSVNYLLSEEAVLLFFDEVNRILEPGGVFIFDAVTPYICKTAFRDYYETNTFDDGSTYQRHSWYDAVRRTQYNAFLLSNQIGETEEIHEQKIRPIREWKKLLRESPLRVEAVYGNFTLRPVQRKSERAHFVCRAK